MTDWLSTIVLALVAVLTVWAMACSPINPVAPGTGVTVVVAVEVVRNGASVRLPGATVTLHGALGQRDTLTTDARGICEWRGIPMGRHSVDVAAAGYVPYHWVYETVAGYNQWQITLDREGA